MWKYTCALIFLIACCNAGPVKQQRKNMPIMAREDSVMAAQESEVEKEMPSSDTAAEPEAAPLVGTLTLPSNATSIRADITDNFSCANKSYGYYADVENDCQIFHVCLPVTYADGKENTFRWSFICPEETIFSQESFTCMRREDMTIECEDSARYYDLNGNFGVPMEEEKQPAAAESEQPDQQPPQPSESELPEPAETAAVAAPEPVQEPAKPVKVQKPKPKPIRRKPAVSYNKPPRKVPVPVAVEETVAETEPEPVAVAVSQVASKPAKPQRFSPRPNKEKPQIIKPTISAPATPIRNELFNSIRKRPTIFNKHSSSTNKPAEESEPAVTEAIQVQAELSEPQPTLKLQTMFVDAAPSAPAEIPEEPAAEASEAIVAIAQPEPETQSETLMETESTKTEAAAPLKIEVEETKPIEAIQEIPAVIEEILEEMPQKIKQPEEQLAEKAEKPEEELAAKPEEQKLEAANIEPAIMEASSSKEEAANPIEDMETAKPADAPISLPATPEMAEPSPLVEEMLENTDSNDGMKQSIGGFKPVDPVMAAEAEQLITEFLNTLRKQEEKPETEMNMAETIEQQPQIQGSESKPMPVETQKESDNVSIEEEKLPEPEVVDKTASVEEQMLETEAEAEPQPQLKLKQDSPIINIMQLNHLPADYQIPVRVIAAPEPEQEPESEALKETEMKPVEAEAGLATAAYMPPISIDDIVELVKERLDQNPKNEQPTPMELILTPGAAAPMSLIPSNSVKLESEPEPASEIALESSSSPVAETEAEAASSPEQEEVILPIYKRISPAEPTMSKVQTSPVTVSKVEVEEEAAPSMPEIREPKSQSRMDARKRRFLFRADAS